MTLNRLPVLCKSQDRYAEAEVLDERSLAILQWPLATITRKQRPAAKTMPD